MPQISINGNVVDPVAQAPQMRTSGLVAANAAHSNYILIQTSTRLGKNEKLQLKILEAQLQEIVCDNTYLLEYKPNDLDAIRNLPFVTWANIYNPEFKVHAELKTPSGNKTLNLLESDHESHAPTQTHTVDIVFHEGIAANSDDVLGEIAECANVSRETLSAGPQKIRVKVEHSCLARLAAIDGVKSIQEVHAMKLFNNKAREVLKANLVDIGNDVYQGEGQVVAVADTGFDLGDKIDALDAFKGRVLELYPRGSRGKTDDPDGHGTHVAGSVLADGSSTVLGEGKIQGTAPKAKLALQSLASDEVDENGKPYVGLGGIPDDLRELFEEPYSDSAVNARIHTNSWGPMQTALRYSDTEAYEIDDFVWQKKDMVICFAAGNEGVDQAKADGRIDDGQIGAYAAAKNSITVGASENNRPDVTTTFGQYGYNLPPLKQDRTANSPDGMAAFSNRGYTPEGRIKPDLVAPGTAILSTASRHPQSREGTPLKDPDWRFMDGTSMATPLVAGCAAVIREVLSKQSKLDVIPAALVKALLINGAVELKGQYSPTEAGPSPNTSSGWGRVNLTNAVQAALSDDAISGFVVGKELDDDEEFTDKVTIPKKETEGSYEPGETNGSSANGATLKITLVWSDPPGSKLQNDLDLIVTDSNGTEYHGNKGETKSEYDRVNNVEQIVWKNIPVGEANIIVRAYQIVRYAQPFALAWSIY